MKIIRYQTTPIFTPISNFVGLREEMDRLFESAFPRLNKFGRDPEEFPIDLYRDKESFVVRAELPGYRKEDLGIEVADGMLTLTAHRKSEAPAENRPEGETKPTAQEHSLSRAITLPELVQTDAIAAKYENGVLTVILPKREEAKPQQINIDVK